MLEPYQVKPGSGNRSCYLYYMIFAIFFAMEILVSNGLDSICSSRELEM